MTVDNLQDMINTLKTLPPIISPTPAATTSSKLERRTSDENMFLSREAALAEAEAKLMGTFNRRDDGNNSSIKKRASLQQLPVLNENGEAFTMDHSSSINKRTSMNSKSLSLSLNGGGGNSDNRKSMNRRSSRNFDEWRNSM